MRLLPRFLGCGRASPLTWQRRGGRAPGARVLGDGSSWGQESHQLTHRPGLLPSITTGLLGPHQSPGPPWQDGRAAQLGVSVQKTVLLPTSLPRDNGCGPRKLAMNSWEVAVAAKIKYPLLLKNFFHLGGENTYHMISKKELVWFTNTVH